MNNVMDFPNSFEEFIKDYEFKDNKEIYTNGCELIPTFRVMQGYEHYERQIRAEEREKVLNAVYDCGWNCEVHSRVALNEMVRIELEELRYEITTRHKDKDWKWMLLQTN